MDIIVDINLQNIVNNYNVLKKRTKAKIAVVIKADAYGLGIKNIATALKEQGVTEFFVSNIKEAIRLRKAIGNESTIYSFKFCAKQLYLAQKYLIIPVINSSKNFILAKNNNLISALNIDTGLHRNGLQINEWQQIKNLINTKNTCLIMSHLAQAKESNNKYNLQQFQLFMELSQEFKEIKKSLAASDGFYLDKKFHLSLVRMGTSILGIEPELYPSSLPGLRIRAKVIKIFNVKKGEIIGYASSLVLKSDIKIACIAIGYGDGMPRKTQNAEVYFKGKPLKIIGEISMDICNAVIPQNYNLNEGDFVDITSKKLGLAPLSRASGISASQLQINFLKRRMRAKINYKK